MSFIEYLIGGLLIVTAIVITAIVTAQNPSGDGLSGAIMGGDSFGGRSRERSNETKMNNLIRILAVVFFALALVGSIFTAIAK